MQKVDIKNYDQINSINEATEVYKKRRIHQKWLIVVLGIQVVCKVKIFTNYL